MMKEHSKDTFSFTSGEKRGAFVLAVILVVIILYLRYFQHPTGGEEFDYSGFQEEIENVEKNLKPLNVKEEKKITYPDRNFSPAKAERNNTSQTNYRRFTKQGIIKVDINLADTNELMKISGIGPVLSKRIIKYRDLLGGFYQTGQLLEVYGIDEEKYKYIIKYLLVDSSGIRKIDLNSLSKIKFNIHPYLTTYEVKSIIHYRNFKGRIDSLGELIGNNLLSETKYIKIKPYLFVTKE